MPQDSAKSAQAGARIDVDWNALRETKTAHIEQWSEALGLEEEDYRNVANTIRGDSARVNALRALQTCESELDRIDVLEAIDSLSDQAAVCRARATLASIEGSHGPAKEWTRLAMEIEREREAAEEARRQAAAQVGDPDSELGKLAQILLRAPQAAREELAQVLLAGRVPDDWRPSRLIRVEAVANLEPDATAGAVARDARPRAPADATSEA